MNQEEKIVEFLSFLLNDMKIKNRDLNTYRYRINENDLQYLKSFNDLNQIKSIIKECKDRGFLDQIELGISGNFAMTQQGLDYISE